MLIFSVPAIWNEEVVYNIGQLRSLQTVYKNINQLPPGYMLIATENGTVNIVKYYEISYITRQEEQNDKRTEQEMIDGVREHLLTAIRLRMRADVKVGVYLSGGLDSSTLLGMATTFTDKPIDTYSIAFKDHAYFNEQSFCIGTNKFLGPTKTTPHILEITHDQLAQHFEECVFHYEYPLMASGVVAKYILSKVVRDNNGKVVLTGEGSDEIFSGYVNLNFLINNVLFRYSPFRQDYLLYDLPNDPSIYNSLDDQQRQQILKTLSSNSLAGAVVLDDKQREPDCIQTIGYFPSQERSLFFALQGVFADRLNKKFKIFV